MMKQEEYRKIFRASELIANYLSEKESGEKLEELEAWLQENEKNKALFEKICAQETVCEKIRQYEMEDAHRAFEKFLQRRNRLTLRRRTYWWSACAVAVILLGGVLLQRLQLQEEETNVKIAKQDAPVEVIQGNRPVLTLATGKQLAISGQSLAFESTEAGQRVIAEGEVIVQQEDSTANPKLMYYVMDIPPMCDFHFTLSDGTKVWMNASSSLRYPVQFSDDSRTVYAEGEVYFEVAKDEKRPFYVEVGQMKLAVLGTSFNIKAYPNEKQVKVTLAEGKVSVSVQNKDYELTPGHQLCMGDKFGGVNIRKVDLDEELSWRRGFYVFKKSRLEEVASTLQYWYNVKIVMTSKIGATTTYTGVVNKEEPIEVFMRRLEEVSNVKCVLQDNTIMIY